MTAVLIDDEKTNLDNLRILLQQHCPTIKVLAEAGSVTDAISLIELHRPELLFLDIQLGKSSGFDLLVALQERSFEVIFVTAYDQYGIQAIKSAALDYLLKPVSPKELVAAVDKAESHILQKKQNQQLGFLLDQLKPAAMVAPKIALPMHNEIRYVAIADIVRCEASNTYTFFFLAGGDKVLVSKPLKEYADVLKPHGFLRAHQSHLVNPSFVRSWLKEDGGILLMANNEKIPISRPNRETIKQSLGK